MKVLITGGAGFIGYHTSREFLNRGWDVMILDNLSTGKQKNVDDLKGLGNVEFSEFWVDKAMPDYQNDPSLEDVTAVLHLAAQVSVQRSISDPLNSSTANLRGFLNMLEFCRRTRVPLVYASSAAVYGAGGGTQALAEFSESTRSPMSPYGLDKLVTDMYAHLFYRLYQTRSIGLRYFNVYGPRQDPSSPYSGVISKFISRGLKHEPLTIFGDGEQTRNFVYVEDVAKINFAACAGMINHQGPLNVGNPSAGAGAISINELVRTINKLLPSPVTVEHGKAQQGDVRHSLPDLNQLFDYTPGMQFTSLEEGLGRLIKYMEQA